MNAEQAQTSESAGSMVAVLIGFLLKVWRHGVVLQREAEATV